MQARHARTTHGGTSRVKFVLLRSNALVRAGSCSGSYDLRIIFKLVEHEGVQAILLETIGTHDEVY